MSNINERVAKVLALALRKPVGPNDNFKIGEPIEWDSLMHIEIMLLVEEEFSVQIRAEQISVLASQKQIIEFLKSH